MNKRQTRPRQAKPRNDYRLTVCMDAEAKPLLEDAVRRVRDQTGFSLSLSKWAEAVLLRAAKEAA